MVDKDDLTPAESETEQEPIPPTLRGEELAIAMSKTGKAVHVVAEADIGAGNGKSKKNSLPASPITTTENSDYPEAPEHGISGSDEYYEFIAKMNAHAVKEFADFKANPEKYRQRDPENPDKYIGTTIHTCADGRCNPALFSDPANPLDHLNLDWQPAAGLIYFPDVEMKPSCGEIEGQLDSNPDLMKITYETLDLMYGPAIEQFKKEHEQGITSRYFIEFQAHWNKDHYPTHGCGAWSSNLANAQKETIKNAVVVEKWLKERYPEESEKGLFKVIRSIQDNSEKGNVYEGAYIDSTLTAEEKGEYAGLFEEVKDRFASPKVQDREKHIVRPYTGNPFNIDTAEHSEQGVRVTSDQWANTLNGQSSMETTWNRADVIAKHNNILLGIIGKNNFSKANPNKPHYLHFELRKGDDKQRANYELLREIMKNDSALQARLADGSLFLAATEIDPETKKSERLQS